MNTDTVPMLLTDDDEVLSLGDVMEDLEVGILPVLRMVRERLLDPDYWREKTFVAAAEIPEVTDQGLLLALAIRHLERLVEKGQELWVGQDQEEQSEVLPFAEEEG